MRSVYSIDYVTFMFLKPLPFSTLSFLILSVLSPHIHALTVDELAAQFESYKKQQALEFEKIRSENKALVTQNKKLKKALKNTQAQVENNAAAFETVADAFAENDSGSNYKDKIVEIRIEGHTSSEWRKDTSEIDAYINNMELSQNRTRSVLDYTFYKSGLYKRHNWAKKMITANGLSSSKLIRYKKDSTFLEDRKRSRRVEFKVVTISKELIQQIIRRNINYEK